ncbi:MAG: hypothetical protein DESF_02389 [Desulfovibrio sp.]
MYYCNIKSRLHSTKSDTHRSPCQPFCMQGRASSLCTSLSVCLLAAVVYFFSCTPALAHRVNIFAWTEGPQVMVQCGFSGGSNVKNGKITVYDAANNAVLLEGLTDANGMFHFDVPPQAGKHGLRIRINAGEGHQNEWQLDAEELAQTSAPSDSIPVQPEKTAPAGGTQAADTAAPGRPSTTQTRPAAAGGSASPASMAEIRASVDAALEAQDARINALLESRLAPLRRQLAEMRQDGPGLREIAGGMGWLVGLAGIALYFRSRHR